MENALVTVVVPVYNVEKYLDRCVESIVNQTYHNLEIILVDDGSLDRCPQMCDEWAHRDNRIRVIHKKNAGLGMARNTGIENANGAYICFFDSDDFVANDTVEQAYAMAKEYHAELVVFGMMNVSASGEVVGATIPETPKFCYQNEDVQELFLPDWIDSRNCSVRIKNLCLSACSCLFSMELIHRTQWRFVSERELISEDSYSLIWLSRYIRCVAILEKAYYCYCDNESSLTRTYRADRYEKIRKFYTQCLSLAKRQEFAESVQKAIAGVTLSFVIAAMKQIAASDLSRKQKRKEITAVVSDPVMRDILRITKNRYKGFARKLLIFSMQRNWNSLTCILLIMQVRRNTN